MFKFDNFMKNIIHIMLKLKNTKEGLSINTNHGYELYPSKKAGDYSKEPID